MNDSGLVPIIMYDGYEFVARVFGDDEEGEDFFDARFNDSVTIYLHSGDLLDMEEKGKVKYNEEKRRWGAVPFDRDEVIYLYMMIEFLDTYFANEFSSEGHINLLME